MSGVEIIAGLQDELAREMKTDDRYLAEALRLGQLREKKPVPPEKGCSERKKNLEGSMYS